MIVLVLSNVATNYHSKLSLGHIEECIESYVYMVYFLIVIVVIAFSDLWPKKVIIYNLVIDTLIPKYNAKLAHPSGTPFYYCNGFSHNRSSSLCLHLHRSLHGDLKHYSPSFMTVLAVPYIRIKDRKSVV